MTLEQYLIALLKQWKLMVTCVVVLGVAAYTGSKLITPIYQSTALVQIVFSTGNNQAEYYSLLSASQLIQTETTLATSDQVLGEVASHYPGLTTDELWKEVTAAPKLNTQLFEIDVRDPSPTRAAALANDVANTLIQQQFQIGQQVSALNTSFLVIAQPAQPPSKPVQPDNRLNTIIGLLAGLLLGISLALLFEQLDPHVRTPKALTQLLGWPILATISQAESKEDVINPTGNSANVETYRNLRTNIGFSAIEKPLRTLLVTSAASGDGKSVIAANLAIFMARAGKSTLLVEADLRHPTQHEQFGLPAHTMGFSNAIMACSTPIAPKAPFDQLPLTPIPSSLSSSTPDVTSTPSLDPFIQIADIPDLGVMLAGTLPPDLSDLLDSKAMSQLLTVLDSCGSEVVIFDTPPLLGLSDASILASKVDGTLVVVDITSARRRHLKQLKAILEQAGANVLGCVVNKQHLSRDHAIYSYPHTTHKRNDRSSHSKKVANPAAVSAVTPDISTQSKTQPGAVFSDETVKLERVHFKYDLNLLGEMKNGSHESDR